jgi:hypothetical protein
MNKKQLTLGDKIDAIYHLREQKYGFDAQAKKIQETIDQVKQEILGEMEVLKIDRASGDKASAFIEIKFHPSVVDKEKFFTWAVKNKKFEFVQSRCNTAAIKEFHEQKNKLPEGIEVHTEAEIMLRKK